MSTIVFLEQAHWLHVVCGCFFGVIMGPSSCDRSYGLQSEILSHTPSLLAPSLEDRGLV